MQWRAEAFTSEEFVYSEMSRECSVAMGTVSLFTSAKSLDTPCLP